MQGISPFVGTLVPVVRISGNVYPGFPLPLLGASSPACNGFLRVSSGVTSATLLMVWLAL